VPVSNAERIKALMSMQCNQGCMVMFAYQYPSLPVKKYIDNIADFLIESFA